VQRRVDSVIDAPVLGFIYKVLIAWNENAQ
jgi:hypothetical protein